MLVTDIIDTIYTKLFTSEDAQVYAVLDGASIDNLLPKLDEFQPECDCLYTGELSPDMSEVAPYLVKLKADSQFTEWLISEGWGNHWGIFMASHAELGKVRRHLRTYTVVRDAQGQPMRFRFYDPRVLRLYLPTCNYQELSYLFGPIDYFWLEDEDARTAIKYSFEAKRLITERITLEQP